MSANRPCLDKRRLDITGDGAIGEFYVWKAFGGSLEHGFRFRGCFPSVFLCAVAAMVPTSATLTKSSTGITKAGA